MVARSLKADAHCLKALGTWVAAQDGKRAIRLLLCPIANALAGDEGNFNS
jgi:hypothetical protein